MKITKRQLRRIIREEKARLLSEQRPSGMSMDDSHRLEQRFTTDSRDFLNGMKTVINGLMELPPEARIKNAETLIANLESIIDQALSGLPDSQGRRM